MLTISLKWGKCNRVEKGWLMIIGTHLLHMPLNLIKSSHSKAPFTLPFVWNVGNQLSQSMQGFSGYIAHTLLKEKKHG